MRFWTLGFIVALGSFAATATANDEASRTPTAVPAQSAANAQQGEAGLIVPPSAPRAAQIEPMVEPVKRSAPQTPPVAAKSEKALEKAKPAAAAKSSACGSGKKRARGDKCVKVAEDGKTKTPARKK